MITVGAHPATVHELVELLAACWTDQDAERAGALWAESNTETSYLGEELAEPLFGTISIARHLARTFRRLESASVEVSSLVVSHISADVAIAIYVCTWRLHSRGMRCADASHSRVAAVCRRQQEGWRLVHYMEDYLYLPEARP